MEDMGTMCTSRGFVVGLDMMTFFLVEFPICVRGYLRIVVDGRIGHESDILAENRKPLTSLVSSFNVTLNTELLPAKTFILFQRLCTTAKSISPKLRGIAKPRYQGRPNLLSGEKPV